MSDAHLEFRSVFDTRLVVHRMGRGRPVLLLHGLFSSAFVNWIDFGHAEAIAAARFEAIMPDARAHGASDKPHHADAYPKGVLVSDIFALVEAMNLTDFDLVGFSLGSHTALQAVIEGLRPRRLVLAGMGLEGITNWDARSSFMIDVIDRFDRIRPNERAFFAKQFMTRMRVDRVAARLLLKTIDNIPLHQLKSVNMPVHVLCGHKDHDNGSPQALARALPSASFGELPGTHMSCIAKPDLGKAIAHFLAT